MVDILKSFPVSVVIGTLLGALSGMGVGGGSLLILWLSLVLGMESQEARLINLMFFLPCAVICTAFRIKKGSVALRVAVPAAVCGCVCAYIAAKIELDATVLRKIFGVLLLLTGVREVLYRDKKAK